MKIAILLMVQKINPQLNSLIKTFDKAKFDIFIHVDKKVENLTSLMTDEHIIVLKDRISITPNTVDFAHAHIKLLKEALAKDVYLHYTLMSDSHLPILNTNDLFDELKENKDISYINISTDAAFIKKSELNVNLKYPRFMAKSKGFGYVIKKIYQSVFGSFISSKYRVNYFGLPWMSLSHDFVDFLFYNYNVETELLKEYKNSLNVEQTMIHTLLMNSKFKTLRKDVLTLLEIPEENK